MHLEPFSRNVSSICLLVKDNEVGGILYYYIFPNFFSFPSSSPPRLLHPNLPPKVDGWRQLSILHPPIFANFVHGLPNLSQGLPPPPGFTPQQSQEGGYFFFLGVLHNLSRCRRSLSHRLPPASLLFRRLGLPLMPMFTGSAPITICTIWRELQAPPELR